MTALRCRQAADYAMPPCLPVTLCRYHYACQRYHIAIDTMRCRASLLLRFTLH